MKKPAPRGAGSFVILPRRLAVHVALAAVTALLALLALLTLLALTVAVLLLLLLSGVLLLAVVLLLLRIAILIVRHGLLRISVVAPPRRVRHRTNLGPGGMFRKTEA